MRDTVKLSSRSDASCFRCVRVCVCLYVYASEHACVHACVHAFETQRCWVSGVWEVQSLVRSGPAYI